MMLRTIWTPEGAPMSMQSRPLFRTSTPERMRWLASSLMSRAIGSPELSVEDDVLEGPVGVVNLEDLTWTCDDNGARFSCDDCDACVFRALRLRGQVFLIGSWRDDHAVPRLSRVEGSLYRLTGTDC